MSGPKREKPRFELGVRYKDRKKNPPPGLVWRRVKNGETLFTIAEEYLIRPIDLVLYNFHTVKQSEINWYLYNYVGCRQHKGDWYVFSSVADQNKGWILVPEIPNELKRSPLAKIDAVRNGAATLDTKLQVKVIEWLATGETEKVSGKWLYVFSGSGGVDFGERQIPFLEPKEDPNADQAGSAFTLHFPGYFLSKESPDRLEYEILITSENAPTDEFVLTATGANEQGKSIYEYGSKWYFLSDPTILKNARTDKRETRTTHAWRNSNTVIIDLEPDGVPRRYYFLLSPIQLGPEAIKFAMDNPQGLTPLLRLDADPTATPKLSLHQNYGPTPDDIKQSPITLRVIDPFAWAESIAERVYEDALKQYSEWIGSKQNETLKELYKETGWETIDHLLVAQLLKGVRDKHPEKDEIDDEIKDRAKWFENIEKFEKRLFEKTEDITAKAHRELLGLIRWLEWPAHKIIETAILKDAVYDTPQDAIDVGQGILHWAICTENMYALEPGIIYLQALLNRPNSFTNETVFRHFKDLDKDSFKPALNETQKKAFRYSYAGILSLLSLKDFVSPLPPIAPHLTREGYLEKLAEYNRRRRDNLIKFFEETKTLPVRVSAPPELQGLRPASWWNWTSGSTAINALLDTVDKWTTYVIEPDINIRDYAHKSRILNRLARIEEWFQKRPRFAMVANAGSSYALKFAAMRIGIYNMWAAFHTARYDYQKNQMTVSGIDRVSAVAGMTLALQDVLAELAVICKRLSRFQTLFPQLMVAGGGPRWGVGAAVIKSFGGRLFAGVNVLAMVVSGMATFISMERNMTASRSLGDYTAANYYGIGAIGGLTMTAGALIFGYALMKAGSVTAATGVGATVGIVLFFVGGILTAIGTIGGAIGISDDYVVFARKCFLGKQGNLEPRFSFQVQGGQVEGDPPDWSLAAKKGRDTWPIEKQKRALFNLLGRYALKTAPQKIKGVKKVFQGYIEFEMKVGLLTRGAEIEVSLQYGSKGKKTRVLAKYVDITNYRLIGAEKGDLFNTEKINLYFESTAGNPAPTKMTVTVFGVKYESQKGKLIGETAIHFPETGSVVRCRKLVAESDDDTIEFDDNEELSALFS